MTKAINFYLDGMISWTDLSRKDQVWVWVNRPEFCPASSAHRHDGRIMEAVEMKSPPCRVCGNTKWVAVWQEDRPEETVCMECCESAEHANGETGHEFDRGSWLSVPSCIHCGQER